jgi:hypothetical protein
MLRFCVCERARFLSWEVSWIANEVAKLESPWHATLLLHCVDEEVLAQATPGTFCSPLQSGPVQVISMDVLPELQMRTTPLAAVIMDQRR